MFLKKIIKKTSKFFFYFTAVILLYLLISVVIGFITVNRNSDNPLDNKIVFLSSNGIHLSIVIPIENISGKVLDGLQINKNDQYLMFGWGNENFYLNTPTWNDFKFRYGFEALFLESSSAIQVRTFNQKNKKWTSIKCNAQELKNLNIYIQKTFKTNSEGNKIIIPQNLYSKNDTFYSANGNYSFVNTCNTWVNTAFKESGLKASYWTIFDFGLLNKYE